MNNKKTRLFKTFVTIFVFALAFVFEAVNIEAKPNTDKLKTEEILAKHLDSIGTADARKSITSIMASGTAKAVSKGRNAGETDGLVVMISDGEKNLIGMRFPINDYPYEKMGYDGNEFTVAFLKPGQRSLLGSFMLENKDTFKVGILGGTLSTAWELLNYDEKVGKLKCGGIKTVDEIKAYKCDYSPRKSDLNVNLYFDAETFRHFKTEYTRVISGGQGLGVNNSARQQEKRYKLVEIFSDFKEVNKLTLPHKYTLTYEATENDSGLAFDWRMELNDFKFNESIEAKNFKADVF